MDKFLIKFFRDRDKLDSFLDGMFWCNTPEFYRLEDAAGVGDKNESCVHSYRASRDGVRATSTIEGLSPIEITSSTWHNYSLKDRWMHCWFEWNLPKTDKDGIRLVEDINRMMSEFGNLYTVLLYRDISEFISRVDKVTDLNFGANTVRYSTIREEWNSLCKDTRYAYQREFRFLLGECSASEVEPQKIYISKGFRDIVLDCPPISMKDENTNELLFELTTDGCMTSLK
jgi:hypothetical protein